MINRWCSPRVWLCKTLMPCLLSHQLYNVCRAWSQTSKQVVCFMVGPLSSFMCRVELNLWRILQFSHCHKKLWSSWFKHCSVGGGRRQMQRSVGACTERVQMCQQSECHPLCSQLAQTGSKSALCSFWVFLRNLHLWHSRNRETISMGKELGRGAAERGWEGGCFPMQYFQPFLKRGTSEGKRDCKSLYNLLSFFWLFFGVAANWVQINKWLPLEGASFQLTSVKLQKIFRSWEIFP